MSSIKKMILKDERGTARAVLTMRLGENNAISFPSGICPIALEIGGKMLFCKEGALPPLPQNLPDLSVLAEKEGERLFATTRIGEAATLAKWRLLEGAKVPKSPLANQGFGMRDSELRSPLCNEEPSAREPLSFDENALGQGKESSPADEKGPIPVDPSEKQKSEVNAKDPLARARRLIEEGEPFDLFCELMPQSRWAKIENEECLCLIGIVKDGDRERVLYGVAGTPGYPPDEDKLWTYFPTSEEEGYYLTEYEQL